MALNDATPSWVHDRLSSMGAPDDWRPDSHAARGRLTARRDQRRRRRVILAWQGATAAIVLALLAATPSVKVAAERAWDVLFARDISILRVDMDRMPAAVRDALQSRVSTGRIEHRSVASLEEASRMSGFSVRGVPATVLPETPMLFVVSPVSGELVLSVHELTRAARSVGVDDEVVVQSDWDGARIRVETGSLAVSEYGKTTLIQTTPLAIKVPSGFDMPAFVGVALRLLGFNAAQASALAQRAAAAPVAFLGIPPGERVRISEVPLGRGMGTMIRDLDEGELTLVWSTADRLYVLTGPIGDELAFSVANALE